MTKIRAVHFHPGFETGQSDKPALTDAPFMTEKEQERMEQWVLDIMTGQPLEGLNKPSWTHGGATLSSAKAYRDNNVWHYHCGPYRSVPPGHRMTGCDLPENLMGKPSAAIYHYAKQHDVIVVLGFSREHIPFPDAMSRKNPLRHRSFTWRMAIPKSGQ